MSKLKVQMILWKDITQKDDASFEDAGYLHFYQFGVVIAEDKEGVTICHSLEVPEKDCTVNSTDGNDYVCIPKSVIIERVTVAELDTEDLC